VSEPLAEQIILFLYETAEKGASVMRKTSEHRFDTVVIGGGQAGLAVGYHLAHQNRDFVILDAASQVGDAWRSRWDSLRLFTPARYSGLPKMPFPAPDGYFPTKDQMADYLEAYAARFDLPVRSGVSVATLTREEGRYLLSVGDERLAADRVVVATGPFQQPHIPAFASELDPRIVQLHCSAYRNADQLQEGGVLVVGAGNSGVEIALELAATRGTPLIRLRPKDIVAAGVERVPRTIGVRDGQPMLEGGHVPGVANVLWCTGFAPDFRWIELPVLGEDGYPVHYRGVVKGEPGLYFVGLQFLYSLTSSLIGGVGQDAAYVCEDIAARSPSRRLRRRGAHRAMGAEQQAQKPVGVTRGTSRVETTG
jgi:putative flavoprotein involved in K+ transport